MLVQEQHIHFSLGLQKLGALSRRKFYPEEIDAFLNTAMDQFVLDCVRVEEDDRGFQRIQVDVDKIRPLIMRDVEIPTTVLTKGAHVGYQATLPSDYAHLVSDSWKTAVDCAAVTSTPLNEIAHVLPAPKTTKATAPYYGEVKLEWNGQVIVDLTEHLKQGTISSLYAGMKSKEDHFLVLELIQEVFNERFRQGLLTNVVGLYYGSFKHISAPGQLILVTRTSGGNAKLTIDGTEYTHGGTIIADTQKNAALYTTAVSRVVKASVVDDLIITPFYGPTKTSPLSLVEGTRMRVYSHGSYIVNRGYLTYVRKHRRISLSLQRHCELAPEFHPTIVNMAVQYAAGRLEQPNLYQVTATENKSNQ